MDFTCDDIILFILFLYFVKSTYYWSFFLLLRITSSISKVLLFLRLYASFVDVILNNMLKNEEGKICDNNIICKFLIFIVTYFYSYISFILLVLGSYI